jgi:peptidoglycan/LPS O-acetylase OafA/YrhL
MENKTSWIFEFDYIRTIAILAVLIAHGYGCWGGAVSLQPFMVLLGAFGVILFFFISGFLISRIIPESLAAVLTLMKNRILRIAPLYWIALFLTALLYWQGTVQGFWIKNFNSTNVALNSIFLIYLTPQYDIPPFWFISSLVLFDLTYMVSRCLTRSPFYFVVSSLAVYFLFLTLESGGWIWATNAFIYFLLGSVLGILYHARLFTFDKITAVPSLIAEISRASYATYLFHLLIFSAMASLFARVHITGFYICTGIAITTAIGLGALIQRANL